ncbi:MAG TPA: four-carbon acid sugar kinase family protein [Phycisphaerae bacterium]|nr:four-carbon acid sugar kinase family protein [Phycisphaerae bacterium]HOJ74150.1 four-carbon acid sugar kinase family protein [Phycisphaerae bacterium]HOM50744.1 four-carbon acid sugar kinase family protein [Phycisphaerae bacterium]HON64880.1 four-carbon acid sugar kinase family protein [Phycisphaerae bacterium]HOQ84671.1 four-carbon acid sugar kinase family protein [Phycisphaerae bacterium]
MAAITSSHLLLGFYGDDFTGSTDAMEGLTRAGLRTALFIKPPRPEQLAGYPNLRAVGIAGCSRSLTPERMDLELKPAFKALEALQLPVVHYKVCSTFDSSPEIGSIGRALDIGADLFKTRVVPLLVGAPILGRYCVFGNLFARSGLDSEPYRLDRHPTMARHPITPMSESDLRVHLARQTRRKIGLVDILCVTDVEQARARFAQLADEGTDAILLDVLYREQEPVIGQVIWEQVRPGSTLFVVGSSGVEYSLTAHWKQLGILPEPPKWKPTTVDRAVVVSGSCSPVTDRQIAWALNHGAMEVPVRTPELIDPATAETEIERVVETALGIWSQGKTVICHSSRGPNDPRRAATAERLRSLGHDPRQDSGRILGEALGQILLRTSLRGEAKRLAVTGGDTSFFVASTLGIEALEMVAPIAPGCPLCQAHIPGSPLDGVEICFKGGQVGRDDFFNTVLNPDGAGI